MPALPLQPQPRSGPRASRRLLQLAGDDRLVAEMRRGNESALEAAYERHGTQILSFCRHMLGSREEAEEAVQHSFAAAWSDLQRSNNRPIRLKPWLYAIARNRCLSVLRARRPDSLELEEEMVTAGLPDEIGRRADLRELLADLHALPHEQRAALVLTELEGLSHADVAEALGRKDQDVKSLVFRARSALAESRRARETPCIEVREQLSVLTGGSLRRSWLRRHLQTCEGCREFRDEVKTQRGMLALVLPVVPSAGLKGSVLAAAGLGGGSAGGGAALGGGGALGALGGVFGTAGAKVAAVAVLAGGATAGGVALQDDADRVKPERSGAAGAPAQARGDARLQGGPSPATPGLDTRTGAGGKARRAPAAQGGPGVKKRGRGEPAAQNPGGNPGLSTPVRAKGSPPAPGRVRRGLPAPVTGPKNGQGGQGGGGGAVKPKPTPAPSPHATPGPPPHANAAPQATAPRGKPDKPE